MGLKTTHIYYLAVLEVRSLKWSRCHSNCVSFGNAKGESISLPFPASSVHLILWLVASSSIFKASVVASSDLYTGPTWIIQDNPLISRSLIKSAKSFLLCKVMYSQVPEIRTWPSLRGHYSAYHIRILNISLSLAYRSFLNGILNSRSFFCC